MSAFAGNHYVVFWPIDCLLMTELSQ